MDLERAIEGGRPTIDEYPHLILLGEVFKGTQWAKIINEIMANDPAQTVEVMRAVANAYHLQIVNHQEGEQRLQNELFLDGCLRGEGTLAIAERIGCGSPAQAAIEIGGRIENVAFIVRHALLGQPRVRAALQPLLSHLHGISNELLFQLRYPEDDYHAMIRGVSADPQTTARLLAHMSDAPQAPPAFVDSPEISASLARLLEQYTKYSALQGGADEFTGQLVSDLLNPVSPLSFKELARVHNIDPQELRVILQPQLTAALGRMRYKKPEHKREYVAMAKPRTMGSVTTKPREGNGSDNSPLTEAVDGFGRYLSEIGREPLLDAETEVVLAKRVEAGEYARHLLESDPKKTEWPNGATRTELEYIYQTGKEARDRFVRANLRLVVSVARRYRTRSHMKISDIVQEGNAGLMRAVARFDYRKGYKFSTYATWWIRQAIGRAIADQERSIRIPVHALEIINRMNAAIRSMEALLGRDVEPEEVAAELGMPVDKVLKLMHYSRQEPDSLNRLVGDDGKTELGDVVAYQQQDGTTLEGQAIERVMIEKLWELVGQLPQPYRTVIERRFQSKQETYTAIAASFGKTREWARQLELEALKMLQELAPDDMHER